MVTNQHFTSSRRIDSVQSLIIPIIAEMIRNTPESSYKEIQRINQDITHHIYGPVSGIDELKQNLQKKLDHENDIRIDNRSRIIVTAGSNMGFVNSILTIADPGDEIIKWN